MENHLNQEDRNDKKILLIVLPFWTPLIPPMGIACLKRFLQRHHWNVKAVDASVDTNFKQLYEDYFHLLKEAIPPGKRGNFYSIGHDVLRNHMMAYLHPDDDRARYTELLRILVYNTFYSTLDDAALSQLDKIIEDFYNMLETYFLDLLDREQPSVLGLSVYSGTLPASMFAAALTRKTHPHIKIVLGGGVFADQLSEGSPNMEFFLEQTRDYVDKIIIGEGETLFLKYLEGELPQSQKIHTLKDVNWNTMDIASAGTPDFSDFDLPRYPLLGAYASRSCPFQCSFCSETLQWGKYRKKDAPRIVEEMTQQYRMFRQQLFFMSDSLLNPVITDLAREFLDSGTSLYWDACIRADNKTRDTRNTLLWRKGGFYRARLGLESGSQRVLDIMDKKITIGQIKESLQSLAYAGIKTSTLWVIGHPGETEDDFLQTLDLIEELKDYIYDVEGTPFWYHLSGQSNSEEWLGKKSLLLYPPWAKKMLVTQTWIIDCQPEREEIYHRLNRFIRHHKKLGIPNPYSMLEIHNADERWRKLHPNAVPPLAQFKNSAYIDEIKNIKEPAFIREGLQDDGDFGF